MPYGQLEVTVVEVKRIKETDFFDKALPFVCLSLDKHNKQKTRAVQDAGSEATWNEKFQFDIVEGRYELFLEVFDEDADNDELIGGAIVPLQQVFKQGNVDEWFNITRPSGKPIGEIRISMNFENKGPTSGPPGHTPYPVPNGPGYFSPPNSSSSTQGYIGNQVPQEILNNLGPEGGTIPSGYGSGAPPPIKAPQAFFSNLGPEGGNVPSGYGSGTPPPIKAPQSTGPPAYPAYPTAGGGFPDPSSYINVQPTYGAPPPDYKLPSSEQYHEEQ